MLAASSANDAPMPENARTHNSSGSSVANADASCAASTTAVPTAASRNGGKATSLRENNVSEAAAASNSTVITRPASASDRCMFSMSAPMYIGERLLSRLPTSRVAITPAIIMPAAARLTRGAPGITDGFLEARRALRVPDDAK